MNKRIFIEYVSESNFRELFIREMGWNNPKGQTAFDITIDETTYEFQQIADRSGFQVLTCEVKDIPTSSMCKKIDTRLRRTANDYICIYHMPQSEHHLWVVPVKKVDKRDLVLVEYESAAKADFLFEKMSDLCFAFDERTTIMDVKERVQAGFIVNSEKITKDFYTGFRKEHTNFAKYITGIDDEITDLKKNRNKQWYTSVMLNRLMFCYFIQKKGFLNLNVNYLREKLAWVKSEKGEGHFYDSFYRGFLLSLFHDGLNSPRHQPDFVQKYGRIPYLNGGMFGIHELEEKYPKHDIADEAFESLFAFFDQWHWHLDDRLTASGKDINPDVLGYIFEQYINDRAQMGAYYTKEDITEYIGRNTILPFLMDATKKADERPFKTNGEVWQFLRESGDTYIFDAVKKGAGLEIPEHIAVGLDTTKPNLLERRSHWNEKTPEAFALPTEIWRETIERLQRYASIRQKIEHGEVKEINDFITFNLDIRQFVQDLLSRTEDHLLVKHFYTQLRRVTILDPTCGSGAFLFAALNILEPLYEICIDRMQAWNDENPHLFKTELEEISGKYRSNIRYFIYKNIILRNLYGVDIMVEATEIAKLRLFLKMVAVVDVVPRDPNLGLDPLPDIDFNIRCGNTLVGYATNDELEKDLVEGDMFANAEFKDKVHMEMDKVALAYERFKDIQLLQSDNLDTYKQSKADLKARLTALNKLLNDKLYKSTVSGNSLKYEDWLKSHQPFHWLAEYYDIINGNGGFDVVIGNPPYVEYPSKDVQYTFDNLQTSECGNLYGCCIERALNISNAYGKFSFIVPVAITCSKRMANVISILKEKSGKLYFSNYDDRPGKLFEMIEHLRACIIISLKNKVSSNTIFSTKYNRWYTENRSSLFKNLCFDNVTEFVDSFIIPKFSYIIESEINRNIRVCIDAIGSKQSKTSNNNVYYRAAGGGYFLLIKNQKSITYINGVLEDVKAEKKISLFPEISNTCIGALLSSTLFYWNYIAYTDCRNLQKSFIESFKFPFSAIGDSQLAKVGKNLFVDYEKKKYTKSTHYKTTGNDVIYDEYYPKKSKPIIDEIDKVLAKHYGFTEEELDFIINYDIKYRMGDELGEDGESEPQPNQEERKVQPTIRESKPHEQKKVKETQEVVEKEPLAMFVSQATIERIASGEKTTLKRFLDDDDFAKEVLVTVNGKIKLSKEYCPYTAKNISSVKLVSDKESIVKKVTKISFRTGINPQGKTAWKIIFHF